MFQIWLIRHAESEANAGERTTDPAKIGLTKKGHEQAVCLVNAFKHSPHLVITSPYLRTKQTAVPLLERFDHIEQQEWAVQEFTCISPERCRNSTAQERRPLVIEYWARSDPSWCDGDGAESFASFIDRVDYFIGRIKSLDCEFTAVISHGHFIRAVLWRLISEKIEISSLGMRQFRNFLSAFEVFNASMIKLQMEKDSSVWIGPIEKHYIPLELLT